MKNLVDFFGSNLGMKSKNPVILRDYNKLYIYIYVYE